jgi:hypothetical protein
MAMLWSSEVPNLTEALANFLEVAARFPEWVAVAGLPGSLVTEGKTAATAATLTMVAGIAELGQNLAMGSRIAAAKNSDETGLALKMQCSLVLSLAEFLPFSSSKLGTLRCYGPSQDTGNRSKDLSGCGS